MRKYLLGAAMLLVVAAGCKKDKDLKNATVIDSGDIASTGCGYLLQLEDGGDPLRPLNIPSNFMHNGLKVKVKYDTNGDCEICQLQSEYRCLEEVNLTIIKRNTD